MRRTAYISRGHIWVWTYRDDQIDLLFGHLLLLARRDEVFRMEDAIAVMRAVRGQVGEVVS